MQLARTVNRRPEDRPSAPLEGSEATKREIDPPTDLRAVSSQKLRVIAIDSVVSVGGDATVIAQATANTACAVEYFTPRGRRSGAKGLEPRMSDETGFVKWIWRIGSDTASGAAKVRITCGRESVDQSFRVEAR